MTDHSRFLCFNLGVEEFAIPLLVVKEVIGLPETTPVPQAPAHFVGIMNLRGQVLSVLDLRLKLGIKAKPSEETAAIILDLGEFHMGVIVDRINSVHSFPKDMISEKPLLDGAKVQDAITGVVRKEDKLVLLLDITKALSLEDKAAASRASTGARAA